MVTDTDGNLVGVCEVKCRIIAGGGEDVQIVQRVQQETDSSPRLTNTRLNIMEYSRSGVIDWAMSGKVTLITETLNTPQLSNSNDVTVTDEEMKPSLLPDYREGGKWCAILTMGFFAWCVNSA